MTNSVNTTTATTKKQSYFDVWIDTFHGNHWVCQPNRIEAETKEQAITEAFLNNIRNLSEEEASVLIKEQMEGSVDFVSIDDDDFSYRLDQVIELDLVMVQHKGQEVPVYLPHDEKDLELYSLRYA